MNAVPEYSLYEHVLAIHVHVGQCTSLLDIIGMMHVYHKLTRPFDTCGPECMHIVSHWDGKRLA